MRIEEFVQEDTPPLIEVELEDDTESDLWAALSHIDECVGVFDDVVSDESNLNLPLELELKIYKLKDKITEFVNQWDRTNQE